MKWDLTPLFPIIEKLVFNVFSVQRGVNLSVVLHLMVHLMDIFVVLMGILVSVYLLILYGGQLQDINFVFYKLP